MALPSRVPSVRASYLVAVLVVASACDATSPAPSLPGVWGARAVTAAGTDTLTLALGQEGSQISGFAVQRRVDDPAPFTVYWLEGSITGRSVEVSTPDGRSDGFPRPALTLRATRRGGELVGTISWGVVGVDVVGQQAPTTAASAEGQIVLRRSHRAAANVEGTWTLASRTGQSSEDTRVVRDTIVLLRDGRAWRHRDEVFSSYGSRAMWSRRGDWLLLEQFLGAPSRAFSGPSVPYLDSLYIDRDAMVRTIPTLDEPIVERFVRVAPASDW